MSCIMNASGSKLVVVPAVVPTAPTAAAGGWAVGMMYEGPGAVIVVSCCSVYDVVLDVSRNGFAVELLLMGVGLMLNNLQVRRTKLGHWRLHSRNRSGAQGD